MFVATISGIGQTTAMALGNNNSSALSECDLMRAQLSQNMGQTSDTPDQAMISNQKIIVTLAAGTEFYMVFTKPALPHDHHNHCLLQTTLDIRKTRRRATATLESAAANCYRVAEGSHLIW